MGQEKLRCVLSQFLCTLTIAQFAHHFAFDLANTLARQSELPSDLIQGAWHAVVKPVAY